MEELENGTFNYEEFEKQATSGLYEGKTLMGKNGDSGGTGNASFIETRNDKCLTIKKEWVLLATMPPTIPDSIRHKWR